MTNNLSDNNPQEMMKDLYKLNVKFRVLESNLEGYLGNGRNLSYDVLNKCVLEYRQHSKNRLGDCDKLKKRIGEIRSRTTKFKESVENIQPNEEFVSAIKEVMEEIEALLIELKKEQRDSYENLLRSEVSLWQECVFMEKKIDAWATGDHGKEPESMPKDIIDKKCDEKNAVIALQKFLDETGGKTGGWSTIDHQTFLRIRQKYTGINQTGEVNYPRDEDNFLKDLISLLMPKSIDVIKTHEIWYRKYQELQFQKKKAISEWKEQKSKQVDEVEIEIEETPKSSKNDWKLQKKRLELHRQALDSWRAEKMLEEHRVKIEKENAIKKEMEEKKETRERERREMRQMVEEYKQKKQATDGEKKELELTIMVLDKESKKKRIEADSARINERNTRMIEERMIKQHSKQFENEQRLERQNLIRNQVSVTARRDPSRLLKPTSVWLQRLADSENSSSLQSDFSASRINTVQHKAVPTWRRDIT